MNQINYIVRDMRDFNQIENGNKRTHFSLDFVILKKEKQIEQVVSQWALKSMHRNTIIKIENWKYPIDKEMDSIGIRLKVNLSHRKFDFVRTI